MTAPSRRPTARARCPGPRCRCRSRWAELSTVSPGDFTVLTVPDVLEDRGDAWAGIDDAVGDVSRRPRAVGPRRRRARAGRAQLPARLPEDAGRAAARAAEQAPQRQGRRRVHGAQGRARRRRARAVGDAGRAAGRPRCSPSRSRASRARRAGPSFEPKWDGFRSIIFRSGDQVEIGSRNEKPMTRYFPEVVEAVLANFPRGASSTARSSSSGRGRTASTSTC